MPIPPYIADLRRSYGTGPLLLPGVTGVVLRDDLEPGRPYVLWARRTDDGLWSLPSGIVEPHEQPARALAREILEETEVEAEVERLALLSTDPEIVYANGDRCQYIAMTFRCRYLRGEAKVGDEESTAVAWRAWDDPPDGLDPLQRRRLDAALASDSACVFDR